MSVDQQIWRTWTQSLQKWGIAEFIASILESAGPLNIFAAQVVYVSQPFLSVIAPHWQTDSLANMLEDKSKLRSFVAILREEAQ